jgi:hypothetical protein
MINLRALKINLFVSISSPYTPRQWVIKTFNLWSTELEFVESCISKDIRNNSAWNQVR